jgi:hypothetical protein
MATEEQKKLNQMRLLELIVTGLTTSVWDMVGDSAYVFSKSIGENILQVMEKEMGLEIAGESIEDIGTEIVRIFVDEFGLVESIERKVDGNISTSMVKNYIGYQTLKKLMDAGVEQPFTDPIMCTGQAVLHRMGIKARARAEVWEEGKGILIHYELQA